MRVVRAFREPMRAPLSRTPFGALGAEPPARGLCKLIVGREVP